MTSRTERVRMKGFPCMHRRSIQSADKKVEPSSRATSSVSSTIDPPGKMWGTRKRSNSIDTASLSSFSSEEFSVQSSGLQSLSRAIADTAIGKNEHRCHPSRRCHPISFEIDDIKLKNKSNEVRRRPSLWRQLYDNLSSEELKVDSEEESESGVAIESLPSASFKFSLSRASDGDTRASTERHPIGLADVLMADTVDDLDDDDVEDYIFSTHM